MVKILYELRGPNYQVPGLPYEDTYRFVRPVILDGIPTSLDVANLLTESDNQTLTNPWSISVVRGFRDYIPTTFRRITYGMPPSQFQELFGMDVNWVPEPDRTLLQLQTEIEAKGATLDAAIVHSRMDQGTVVNKAHVLNRLYMIGRIYGHLKERDYPFLFGDLTDRTTWHRALSEMKQAFMQYMMEVPVGPVSYPVTIRTPDVGAAELQRYYPYVEWLKQKLGDDLVAILLYGSAARSRDPSVFSDYDNWVQVRDITRAHQILGGTCPAVDVVDGMVVEGYHGDHTERMKHLGVHFFPASDEYMLRHIRFLHDSREFRENTLVLMGNIPFPNVNMDEMVERGISQAYIKLKTIAGSLNWAWNSPEKILGKPSLFEFIIKNMRFFLQHSMNAMGEYKFRDKQELNDLLAERGLILPEYRDDLGYIRDSLLYAMVGVLQLQQELQAYGRRPNLKFMVAEGVARPIEPTDWAKMDDEVV